MPKSFFTTVDGTRYDLSKMTPEQIEELQRRDAADLMARIFSPSGLEQVSALLRAAGQIDADQSTVHTTAATVPTDQMVVGHIDFTTGGTVTYHTPANGRSDFQDPPSGGAVARVEQQKEGQQQGKQL